LACAAVSALLLTVAVICVIDGEFPAHWGSLPSARAQVGLPRAISLLAVWTLITCPLTL